MTRGTLYSDVQQGRALGLDYAAGERVTTLHLAWSTGGERVRAWEWHVSYIVPAGLMYRVGVAPTLGKARAAIAAAVQR